MNKQRNITFYPYKLFEKNENIYLYASKTGGIYLIDNNIKKLLDFDGQSYNVALKWFEKNELRNEFIEAIDIFEKKCVLATDENMLNVLNSQSLKQDVSSVTLMLVQDCNLRCSYCYGGDGQYSEKGFMPLDVAQKSVEFLMRNSSKDDVTIVFFGGEPLIKFSLIKEIVKYARDLTIAYNKKIRFSITTNATLINEEIAEFFKENKFTVTISIDGDEVTHNTNRFYANKTGCYNETIRGIEILKKSNVNIVARATASPENINMTKTVEHLIDLDFKTLFVSEALNLFKDERDFKNLETEYGKMIEQYKTYLDNEEYDKLYKNNTIKKVLNKLNKIGVRNKFCGAMVNTITIDKEGYLYPCHRFVANKEYKIGDVWNGINKGRYTEIEETDLKLTTREKCFSCWAYNICGGGCPNENLVATGKCNVPSVEKCEVFKAFLDKVMNFYLELSDTQKNKLFVK